MLIGAAKPAYTCIANYRGNNLAVGSEDGTLYFFRYDGDMRKFEFVRSWQCNEFRMTKIVSMCSQEINKEDVQLAVVAKSQTIIHINIHK